MDAVTPARGRYTVDRATFLADGVVAIAVTLLALDLKPALPSGVSAAGLAHYLHGHGGQYFAFLLAFWLIARFWLVHHKVMLGVRDLDAAAMWANLLFLFWITCLPVTTAIDGSDPNGLSTTLFAGNLLLVSLSLGLLDEVIESRGLAGEHESAVARLTRRWQVGGASTAPVVVIALAWLVPHAVVFFLLAALSDVPARLAVRRTRRTDGRR